LFLQLGQFYHKSDLKPTRIMGLMIYMYISCIFKNIIFRTFVLIGKWVYSSYFKTNYC